jgi:hypothetical protein
MRTVVFVSAFLTLSIEVFYTRVFSALFWKNTAFAILSLAMLGIGASGILVYLRPAWFTRERMLRQLPWLMLLFAASILASFVWVLFLSRATHTALDTLDGYIALVFAGLLPFVFGGLVLSVVFAHAGDELPRLYRLDLVGAALGAVCVLPATQALNGPLLVPMLALGATLAALRVATVRSAKIAAALASVAVFAVAVLHVKHGILKVTHSHGRAEQNIEHERWDPLARLTVESFTPQTKWLNIDSQVVTPILHYTGESEDVGYLRHNVLQLAYHLQRYPKVLIIGPGGGSDVLSALTFGNGDITGVEVNRSTIRLMRTVLREFTGGLYLRPEINLQIADGRAYVAATSAKFDLIQATFVDTFAASAAGAHTLSENYLYTVDGYGDFLAHLNDNGVLSMSRWGGTAFGFAEIHRTVAIALVALENLGVKEPGAHIVVAQGAPPEDLVQGGGYQQPGNLAESMSTILVKKWPFTSVELDRIDRTLKESKFRSLWLGSRGGADPAVRELVTAKDRPAFFARYRETSGLDITPVTDDRPFFFDMIDPISSLFGGEKPEWARQIYYWVRLLDIRMLHQLLVSTALVAGLLIALPLALRYREIKALPRPASTLGYFVCLGIGYIGIELTLMQRFSLFLEHPVYSLVVFLASMLLFSGMGSANSERVGAEARWKRAAALVAVLAVYGVAIPFVTRGLIGLPLLLKMLVAVALAFPPAYLMGMMFPFGVATVRQKSESIVPWVWGLNSAFSVLGAISSLFLAMSVGFTATWFVFAGAYGLAAVALYRLSPGKGPSPAAH